MESNDYSIYRKHLAKTSYLFFVLVLEKMSTDADYEALLLGYERRKEQLKHFILAKEDGLLTNDFDEPYYKSSSLSSWDNVPPPFYIRL